jgi:hypothetical protein
MLISGISRIDSHNACLHGGSLLSPEKSKCYEGGYLAFQGSKQRGPRG